MVISRFLATGATVALASLCVCVAHGQPMGPGQGMMGQGHMGMSMLRHRYFMDSGIPEAYRDARNPLRPTEENIAAGRVLHGANCATCHGPEGHGDGPTAHGLNPPPANIAALAHGCPWPATAT